MPVDVIVSWFVSGWINLMCTTSFRLIHRMTLNERGPEFCNLFLFKPPLACEGVCNADTPVDRLLACQ